MFLRKSRLEPLPVTMSAVRMGERVLQVGIDDATIAAAIAAKVGLSGNAAIAATIAASSIPTCSTRSPMRTALIVTGSGSRRDLRKNMRISTWYSLRL